MFAGLVITLGSAGLVNQLMSGLVVVYSRALKPGDFVETGEILGLVSEVGLLSTKLYQLVFRVERPEQRVRVLSALHAEIQDAFRGAGVQIMAPHFESQPEQPVLGGRNAPA